MKNKLFDKSVIGMIHVKALPGTPSYQGNMKNIIKSAIDEAKKLANSGVHAIIIENMHDIPYLKRNVGPEIVSSMAVVANEIKRKTTLPLGIQILAGANKEALAVAQSADLDFIRAEGFVFAHVADEGIMESDAGGLLRYRKNIGAENIFILTDIKKKHSSHALTSDISIEETAKAAEFFMSDGLIITGNSTGVEPNLNELELIKDKFIIPVLIGSGITIDNIEKYFHSANAFIIGSHFKENGDWKNSVDEDRVSRFMKKFSELKKV